MNTIYETEKVESLVPVDLTVNKHMDYDADISFMGYFSNDWSPGAIDRELSGGPFEQHDYKYWIPTPGGGSWEDYLISCRKWYTDNGYTKHEAGTAAHQHRAQDYQRICGLIQGEWMFLGIEVVAPWGSASLWGIASDCEDHIEEVTNDLIHEVLQQDSITVKIR